MVLRDARQRAIAQAVQVPAQDALVAGAGTVRAWVLVEPGLRVRAELRCGLFGVDEDLGAGVMLNLDLPRLRAVVAFEVDERLLALPAVDPVAHGVGLAGVLALDDDRHVTHPSTLET